MRFSLAVIVVAISLWSPLHAQNAPGTHQDNGGINGSLSRGDLEKLGGVHPQDSAADAPPDSPRARAKARKDSEELSKSVELSCTISDAQLVISGTQRPAAGGKEVPTRVYEVACSGAMGYLLETRGPDKPIVISCLAAEEARAADVARGKNPSFFCNLAENKDVYARVASLISSGTGAACAVQIVQSFGHSESTQSDYSEVVCKDGAGYLLRLPRPGSASQSLAMSCAQAATQGIKCRLTDSGPVEMPVTLETLKAGLAEHGVTCKIAQARLIGQEDHLKRYVLEYLCADKPSGTIAYLPLPGNANPFESVACAAAESRGLACTLNPSK